jgi:hypothetical protein
VKDFKLAEQERESYERKKNSYELYLKKLQVSYNSQQKKLESFVMLYKYIRLITYNYILNL